MFFVLVCTWWVRADNPVDAASKDRVSVTVEKGMGASDVARLLQEEGVIRSVWKFRWVAARTGSATKLKAGAYVLQPSMSLQEVLSALTGGQQGELKVTIPEGFTVSDIDALLAEMGLTEPGDVQECANNCDFSAFSFITLRQNLAERGGMVEGYLYPDTYFVDPQAFSVEAFLKRLLSTFETRVIDAHEADIAASKRSLHDIVTMASLIEEETRRADERPMVSGILWKRLDIGMGLQVDATVRYIINKPTAAITVTDLQTDSPYNTRRYRGLPPGPIASPGLSSIEAALQPKTSEYLYYLHGNDGVIRYGRTNDEHNANRARYL